MELDINIRIEYHTGKRLYKIIVHPPNIVGTTIVHDASYENGIKRAIEGFITHQSNLLDIHLGKDRNLDDQNET